MASLDAPSIKVLSVDGGGIRGIVPTAILSEIQKRLSTELSQTFDLIAGTSTGGIIALGLGTFCDNGKPYTRTSSSICISRTVRRSFRKPC